MSYSFKMKSIFVKKDWENYGVFKFMAYANSSNKIIYFLFENEMFKLEFFEKCEGMLGQD